MSLFPGFGSKWQVSRGGGEEPRGRRDGKELFYLARAGRLMATDVKTSTGFEAGFPVALFLTPPRQSTVLYIQVLRAQASPDGRRSDLLPVGGNVVRDRVRLLLCGVRDMDCALFMFFGIVPAAQIDS